MSLLFDKSQCNGQYHKHPLMAMCKAPKSSNFPKEEAFFQVHLWLPLTQAFPMFRCTSESGEHLWQYV